MPTSSRIKIAPTPLERYMAALFERAGVPDDEARIVAASLVLAELRGKGSHGVVRVPSYLKRIQAGETRVPTRWEVTLETPITLVADGHGGLGQVVGVRTMERCIQKARQSGLCFGAVRGSSHFGFAGYYAALASGAGMVGIAMSNGPWKSGFVAPWGTRQPLFDTNPIAIAVPTTQAPPIILDMATSQVARGKILLAQQEGRPIPLGWALDAEGQPTTDPAAALAGSLVPLGGYKGAGLALIVDLFCGLFSGASYPHPTGTAHFFAAIAPSAFGRELDFAECVDATVAAIKSLEPVAGVEEILLPGEQAHRLEAAGRAHGLALTLTSWEQLTAAGETLGVPVPEHERED